MRNKRKSSTITLCSSPYDYYRPGKSRRIDNTRISPAHQGDLNLSPTSNIHLAPAGFMSRSSRIVQRSSISILNQISVRDLSFKPDKLKSTSIIQTPHPFTFKMGSNLDTFANLSLKDRLLPKKISGIGHKHKMQKMPSHRGKSTEEEIKRVSKPETKKMKHKLSSETLSQEVKDLSLKKSHQQTGALQRSL